MRALALVCQPTGFKATGRYIKSHPVCSLYLYDFVLEITETLPPGRVYLTARLLLALVLGFFATKVMYFSDLG